jgi:hypothetical protein
MRMLLWLRLMGVLDDFGWKGYKLVLVARNT